MPASVPASDSSIIKISAIVGLVSGISSAALYYLLTKPAENVNQMKTLKMTLIKELRQHNINPPKNDDYTFTKEFMILLYKILFTYQTIGKEIVKEQYFVKRIEAL